MRLKQLRLAFQLAVTILVASRGVATDRSYPNITVESPNGEWRLTAKSPDNRTEGYRAWQDEFVYTMYRGGEQVWTRNQDEQDPKEHSLTMIIVADDGWAAIYTGRDQLVFLDHRGRNRGRVDDLKQQLPKRDRTDFAQWSTAGMHWTPYSLWHFANVGSKRAFAIRTWWGLQMVFAPETGERVQLTAKSANSILQTQVDHCTTLLKYATTQEINDDMPFDSVGDILTATLLAGQLEIRSAIPHLRELNQSEYVALSGGMMGLDIPDGELNPFYIREFTLRKLAQLSLRRLGQSPDPLPAYEFRRHEPAEFPRPRPDYLRPQPQKDRAKRIELVKRGMNAKEVLQLIGSPNFVSYPEWSYDLDGADPKSATITWENTRVTKVATTAPRWLDGLARDRAIVEF